MEKFGFENMALQRMTAQKMHCDPHAKFAPADKVGFENLCWLLNAEQC
jgi:hypothetical protein